MYVYLCDPFTWLLYSYINMPLTLICLYLVCDVWLHLTLMCLYLTCMLLTLISFTSTFSVVWIPHLPFVCSVKAIHIVSSLNNVHGMSLYLTCIVWMPPEFECPFTSHVLSECPFTSHVLSECSFTSHVLSECLFTSHVLSECSFTSHVLSECSFTSHVLSECSFTSHVLSECLFTSHVLSECSFTSHVLSECSFTSHVLSECSFTSHVLFECLLNLNYRFFFFFIKKKNWSSVLSNACLWRLQLPWTARPQIVSGPPWGSHGQILSPLDSCSHALKSWTPMKNARRYVRHTLHITDQRLHVESCCKVGI